MASSQQIFIVAGEASGEAHAARVATALKQQRPTVYISGIGGDAMRSAGVDIVHDFAELAVMGLVEVIKRYPVIKSIYNQTVKRLRREPPDLLILVDYPGFNLKLAKKARQLGIPVLYYISPKVWAWRPGRIQQIKKTVDHIAVLFPFEETLYQQAEVPVTCVGHPLAEVVHSALTPTQAKEKFGLSTSRRVIGVFPGSRRSEISALLPLMLSAVERIENRHFPVEVVIPLAPGIDETMLTDITQHSALKIHIIKDDFYDVIKSCDAIVAASGTVTLEIALSGVPHLIAYKVAPLSYYILKKLVKIPYVGLCNIVTGKNVVTELIQEQATTVRVEQVIMDFLTHPQRLQKAENVRQQVLEALGPPGAAANTAQLIIKLLDTPKA